MFSSGRRIHNYDSKSIAELKEINESIKKDAPASYRASSQYDEVQRQLVKRQAWEVLEEILGMSLDEPSRQFYQIAYRLG